MFLSSFQRSKWKSEKEIMLKMTDSHTDTKPCLEKRELKKNPKQIHNNNNKKPERMKQGKEVFTVKLLKKIKN